MPRGICATWPKPSTVPARTSPHQSGKDRPGRVGRGADRGGPRRTAPPPPDLRESPQVYRRQYPGTTDRTGRCHRRWLPGPWGPSPYCGRVGFRIRRSEACSALTRVAARMVAEPPNGGPLSSECFRRCRCLHRPLRLLPAGATVAGRDSHPLRNGTFARHTTNLMCNPVVIFGLIYRRLCATIQKILRRDSSAPRRLDIRRLRPRRPAGS